MPQNSLPPVYLTGIGLGEAHHILHQEAIAEQQVTLWRLHGEDARRLRTLFGRTGISTRRTAFDAWLPTTPQAELIDWLSRPIASKIDEDYRPAARKLGKMAALNALAEAGLSTSDIGAVITVSCTGLYAPGLELDLVQDLQLPGNTPRYAVNFVGCYAVFPALDLAKGIALQLAATERPHVLVVAVELCSLHYSHEYVADTALAHALFADGAAAAIVSTQLGKGINLTFGTSQQHTIAAEQDMAWSLGSHHFLMKLSSYVPQLLAPTLKMVLPSGAEVNEWQLAIHPGGRRILEAAAEACAVPATDLQASYDIMAEYGNMSSATILYVLHRLLASGLTDKPILAAGFGPGLTLCRQDFFTDQLV